jgi:hypothetical protein
MFVFSKPLPFHSAWLGSTLLLASIFVSIFGGWFNNSVISILNYVILWPYLQVASLFMQSTGANTSELRQRISEGMASPGLFVMTWGTHFFICYLLSLIILSYGFGYVITWMRSRLLRQPD